MNYILTLKFNGSDVAISEWYNGNISEMVIFLKHNGSDVANKLWI